MSRELTDSSLERSKILLVRKRVSRVKCYIELRMSFSAEEMLKQYDQRIRQNMGWEMQPPFYNLISCRCPNPNVDDVSAEQTHVGRDGFQICLDVQNFTSSEISVKGSDGYIEINAKHGDREDEHRYRLPKEFNVDDVVATISSDGILMIQAPRATSATAGRNASHIHIQHTGPLRSHIQEEEK